MALPHSHEVGLAPDFERALVERTKPLALGQLARGVAHEIGNPLCAALGLVELLAADDTLTDSNRELVELLEESCTRIQNVITALGGFAREDLAEYGPVSLPDLVDETVELVALTTTAKDVEIVKRVPPGDWEVEARRAALKQILLNLFLNAQQAMPRGGTATLELARHGEWIEASVTDTGPGIPPELRKQVFAPFFTTRGDREQVGLGLTVARALARLDGGDVRIASQPGEGARVALTVLATGRHAA